MAQELTRAQLELQVELASGPYNVPVRDAASAKILAHDQAQRERIEETEGDAATLRGFIQTYGCTPTMKASECDILRAQLVAAHDHIQNLEDSIKALQHALSSRPRGGPSHG